MTPPNPNKIFKWHSLLLLYLFFFYFSGIYQGLILTTGLSGGTGLRQAIYMSFLWLIPILIFPHKTKLLAALIGVILWGVSLVSLGYFTLYGQDFSQSVIFIIFESNFSESSEFIESYFHWWMVLAFIIYSGLAFFLWRQLKPVYIKPPYLIATSLLITFIVSYPFTHQFYAKNKSFEWSLGYQIKRMEPASPWNLLLGYVKYRQQLAVVEEKLLKNSQLAPLADFIDHKQDKAQTLVLVIGESTNRQRMSLYGYQRKTSPKLEAIKEELVTFDNVYSPRPYTIEVLEQALTFADQQHPDLYLETPTLINMMKQAGYKTYWITNQQTQTKRNTLLTTFSKQADEQVYLNNNRSQNSAQYDGSVLAPLQKIIAKDNTPRKFIIIHLLGTHRKYDYRYPADFAFFDQIKAPEMLNKKQAAEYNSYDNAVLYNDMVLAEIINRLRPIKTTSMLLYFSDHGEEVYDYPNKLFAGRNEDAPSSAMYTVPFILWGNQSWQAENSLKVLNSYQHRAYSASDLIHTWADLTGLSFKRFDASKSIVNKAFKVHPILIGDPRRPDKLRDLNTQGF